MASPTLSILLGKAYKTAKNGSNRQNGIFPLLVQLKNYIKLRKTRIAIVHISTLSVFFVQWMPF